MDVRSTTAEQALVRALLFLRTGASDPGVRAALATTGFGPADLDEGWTLLRAACSVPTPDAPPKATDVRDAARALDAFVQTIFPRARAALRRFDPDYETAVLAMPEEARASNVVAAGIFIERCDALRPSAKRKKTSERDAAVLALLARRGITDELLEEARRNFAVATGQRRPHAKPAAAAGSPQKKGNDGRVAQDALYAWVRDWSDCARTVITRRDWLIRLGIGRRRRRRTK
jgi:hypothetical protein